MIPKNLPDGWTAEESKSYGVVIEAPGVDGGCVTVDENARNFLLGLGVVRTKGSYSGRGWQDRLYTDAIDALKAAMARHAEKRAEYSSTP